MNLKFITIISLYILKRVNDPHPEVFIKIFKTLVGKEKKKTQSFRKKIKWVKGILLGSGPGCVNNFPRR